MFNFLFYQIYILVYSIIAHCIRMELGKLRSSLTTLLIMSFPPDVTTVLQSVAATTVLEAKSAQR